MGGKKTWVLNLLKYFSKKYEVKILTIPPSHYSNNYPIEKLATQTVPLALNFLYVLTGLFQLRRLHKKYDFKAILAQDGVFTGAYSALFGHIAGVQTIIMDYGAVVNWKSKDFWTAYIGHVTNSQMNLLKKVLVLFDSVTRKIISKICIWISTTFGSRIMIVGRELEYIYKKMKIPSNKIKKYRYAVDTTIFHPASSEFIKFYKKEYSIDQNCLVLNVTSRFAPEKGFEYLLPAILALNKKGYRFLLLIAGDGPLQNWIDRYLQVHNLNNCVRVLGSLTRNELAILYQISDIHIYAGSSGGTVSQGLLEAMACGCVPVATDSPLAHIDILGAVGLKAIPIKSTQSLYLTIKDFLSDRSIIADLKERCLDYINENYTLETLDKYFGFI